MSNLQPRHSIINILQKLKDMVQPKTQFKPEVIAHRFGYKYDFIRYFKEQRKYSSHNLTSL